jgi:hypothetical protein
LGDCFLWAVFLLKELPKMLGYSYPLLKLSIKFGKKWVGLHTFWASFSQTRLVTLTLNEFIAAGHCDGHFVVANKGSGQTTTLEFVLMHNSIENGKIANNLLGTMYGNYPNDDYVSPKMP